LVTLIDDLRSELQARLDEILVEADILRKAIAALGPGNGAAPVRRPRSRRAAATAATRATTGSRVRSTVAPSRAKAAAGESRSAERTRPRRTRATEPPTKPARSRGTKEAVLGALRKGDAMTAGEVAAATGLGRGSVSTTLSKLAKAGEAVKADRGYKLPTARSNGRSTPKDS
jgi:DNA-binding transcriptional ArsR family regulator